MVKHTILTYSGTNMPGVFNTASDCGCSLGALPLLHEALTVGAAWVPCPSATGLWLWVQPGRPPLLHGVCLGMGLPEGQALIYPQRSSKVAVSAFKTDVTDTITSKLRNHTESTGEHRKTAPASMGTTVLTSTVLTSTILTSTAARNAVEDDCWANKTASVSSPKMLPFN